MMTRNDAAADAPALMSADDPVCLLADAARPGVLTVVLQPGVAIEVLELQRLGDKCVVQLRYTVTADGAGAAPTARPSLPLAA